MVAKRVEEELERRKDEIEEEVKKRVEEAKKVMEAQMLEEIERRKQEQIEEAKRREVGKLQLYLLIAILSICNGDMQMTPILKAASWLND